MTAEVDPATLAKDFDIHDPAFGDDPYPAYARFRERPGLLWSERQGGYWLVSRYDDVFAALHATDLFSSAHASVPPNMGQGQPIIPVEVDPPDHSMYRQILSPLFGPAEVHKIEADIRDAAGALIDGFIERGSCELMSEFAEPLAAKLFLAFMNWPLDDSDKFMLWARQIIRGMDTEDGVHDVAIKQKGAMSLYGYFTDFLERRKAHPLGDGDIVSHLLAADAGGRALSDMEILTIIFNLFIAGLDTTRNVLGNSIAHLAEHPEVKRRILDDPELIPSAIEEFLRYESPVTSGRLVTRDDVFAGTAVKQGEHILVIWGSAGRDSAQFPDADQVILDRHPNRHIAFGAGPHRCLGSHLARFELRVAYQELHRRLPDYRVADGQSIVRHLGMVRGVRTLPLTFTPGPVQA